MVDFWAQEELPCADVITMSRILHDWGLPRKLELMRKAHAALPEGGAFIASALGLLPPAACPRSSSMELGWE